MVSSGARGRILGINVSIGETRGVLIWFRDQDCVMYIRPEVESEFNP